MAKIDNFFSTIKTRDFGTSLSAVFNLCAKTVEEIIFGRRYLERRIHNYKMLLDVKDKGLSRNLILFRTREEDHKILLEKIMNPKMRVFDIGANIGYYALMELDLLDDEKQLVAFEPVSENVSLLKRNLALNGYNDVTVLNAAISDTNGEREFYFAEESNLGSFHKSNLNQSSRSGGVSNVKTMTYTEAVEQCGLPDLIRMDVEGHEVEIMSQIVEMVAAQKKSPTIIFETHLRHYNSERDFRSVLDRFFSLGYCVPHVASSQASGTEKLISRGYKPYQMVRTDGLVRGLFSDIKPKDASELITELGGIRTVVLAKND